MTQFNQTRSEPMTRITKNQLFHNQWTMNIATAIAIDLNKAEYKFV